MTLWLVRCGADGAYEQEAIARKIVGTGWGVLGDLSEFKDSTSLRSHYESRIPSESSKQVQTNLSQVHAFANRIQIGDLVAMPLKQTPAVAFGRVVGEYEFVKDGPQFLKHQRRVEWIDDSVPRSRIDQDILNSLGAFLSVCAITRNNAEERILALLSGKVVPEFIPTNEPTDVETETKGSFSLPDFARDQIRRHIEQKFDGHQFAALISHILTAQGMKTSVSPPGADGGVDILAGSGLEGFDPPHIVVQVKSGKQVADAPVIRQLVGTVQNFTGTNGLFVSWSGFTPPAHREARQSFFKLRLWDSNDVINNLVSVYDQLPDLVKSDIPLQRVWALVPQDSDS